MKYLKSTTEKEYAVLGKVIPKSTKNPLAVTEEVYNQISKTPVIKSLITNGGILVLERYTDTKDSNASEQTAKLQQLNLENAKLAERVKELEAAASTKPAAKAAKAKDDETAKELAELKAKYAALEKEANEKIAELSAQVEASKAEEK